MSTEKVIHGSPHGNEHHVGKAGNRRREEAADFEQTHPILELMDDAGLTKCLQEQFDNLPQAEKIKKKGYIYSG